MNIVPFYPLRVLPSEDYFNAELIYTFGNQPSTPKVKYFRSPAELFKNIPKDASISCHGMTRQMVALYLLLLKDKSRKELTPHTSFGKYPPWGFPINLFKPLSLLMKQFDKIRAISPYEEEYFKKNGLSQTYCKPLFIDTEYFASFKKERIATGVLCMGAERAVKNIKTIIKACSIVKRKLTIMDEVMPGSPEYKRAFIENDIFVNSSYMEGFSLGVGEAYAAGMKLCLANLPTIRSLYKDIALYHEPDDYKKLAENIGRCTSRS